MVLRGQGQKKAPLRGAGGLDPDVAGLELGGFRRHDDAEGVVHLLLVALEAGHPLDRAVGACAPGHPHPRALDFEIQCRLEGGKLKHGDSVACEHHRSLLRAWPGRSALALHLYYNLIF